MQRVDYDKVAPSFDLRYANTDYSGIAQCLGHFLAGANSIAELGCGTGHWLALASALPQRPLVVGLDRAWGMLSLARGAAPDATCVRGSADSLPWSPGALDRVFCINALHHFPDHAAVFTECARVLRSAGRLMTVGLDPSAENDRWWVYDYFPASLAADRQRYPSTGSIRALLATAGFINIETFVAQRIAARLAFEDAEAQGFLDRRSTSQLLVIDDADWAAGSARLRVERPTLEADLQLWATIGIRR